MTAQTPPTVCIDGQAVPIDDCMWLERRPCGRVVAAVVAVVPRAWALATAEDARQHLHPTEGERRHAERAHLSVEPITGDRYRNKFQARWRCDAHARPVTQGA
jgi:hypothetical protein